MKCAIVLACLVASVIAAPGSWRIIGGKEAVRGQFPYQASVRYRGLHTCGGSILDETTILCAAHCVDGVLIAGLTVRTGNNKLTSQTDSYKIAKVIVHEDYNPYNIDNDIALIKLETPIRMRRGVVEPVQLRQTNIGDSDTVTLSGWGLTELPGRGPIELQFIDLKTISVAECRAIQGDVIVDSEVCTLTKEGEGTCTGDSGSPLVDENKEQIGIVSWGNPCALGRPDVFTRVYSFLDWIVANRN